MRRGLLISLDGLDGTGKSTQCHLLAKRLRADGHAVTECVDPGSTVVGNKIREILLDRRHEMVVSCEAFLFMASRAQLTTEVIRPALESGRIAIADRFLLANVVYQGHAGGLDPQQLWDVGRLATGGLEPELTLVLDLPPETARGRRNRASDRMESRDDMYHERVREGFLAEARRRSDRIRVIDASDAVGVVHQQIYQEVVRVLETHPGS